MFRLILSYSFHSSSYFPHSCLISIRNVTTHYEISLMLKIQYLRRIMKFNFSTLNYIFVFFIFLHIFHIIFHIFYIFSQIHLSSINWGGFLPPPAPEYFRSPIFQPNPEYSSKSISGVEGGGDTQISGQIKGGAT